MASLQEEPQMLSLMGFPGQKHRTHVAVFLLLVGERALGDCSGGREQREACPRILPDSPSAFSPHGLAVCPNSVTKMNLRQLYSYMLSPRTPSGDSLNVRVVLQTLSKAACHRRFTSTGLNLKSSTDLMLFIRNLSKDSVFPPVLTR